MPLPLIDCAASPSQHNDDLCELRALLRGRVHPASTARPRLQDIPYRNFRVIYKVPDPDPHHFDGDHDGIGCEP